MKICPFCAEEIQDAAIICRFCGRELYKKENKFFYVTLKIHFRNEKEGGWIRAQETPAVLAGDEFWRQINPEYNFFDIEMTKNGWEIVPPRNGECIRIKSVTNLRGVNPAFEIPAAIFSGGFSLLVASFPKWWLNELTYKWKKPYDENKEEVFNIWHNSESMNKNEENETQKFIDFLDNEGIMIKGYNK